MSSYTEENLDKLLKKDLIAIVLAMQSKMSASNAEVLEEIHKLNSKFDILQSEFLVTKKVNLKLSSRLANKILTWKISVFMGKIKFIYIGVCVNIIGCYGPKVKNYTAWAESTVFISLMSLSKIKFMKIVLR